MLSELSLTLVAQLLALGLCTGFLAGLLGIGGGMLMVPFLSAILTHHGVDAAFAVKMAIATSMATILVTSLSSVRAHHRRGAVNWPLVRGIAPGLVIGGLLAGAGAFALLKGQVLALLFAGFITLSAVRMVYRSKTVATRALPGRVGQAAVGTGIGFLSGLLGAGGAFVSVPFMTSCGVSIHTAVATSAALGFPIALSNTIGYLIGGWSLPPALPGAVGFLFVPALLVIGVGSVVMAPIGVRTAHRLNKVHLQRVFAALLITLAAYMLYRALMS